MSRGLWLALILLGLATIYPTLPASAGTSVPAEVGPVGITVIDVGSKRLVLNTGGTHGPFLWFAGKMIYENDNGFLGLDRRAQVGGYVVLVYSFNLGGSGTVDEFTFLALKPDGSVFKADLPAGPRTFEVVGDSVVMDLGHESRQQVRASFAGGSLSIQRSAVGPGVLEPELCKWAYAQPMAECAGATVTSCTAADRMDLMGMSSVRGIYHLENDEPHFDAPAFDRACIKACERRARPPEASFAAEVCKGQN